MRSAQVANLRKWWIFFSSPFAALLLAALVCPCAFADDESVEFSLPEYPEVISVPVTLGNAEHLCALDSGATYNCFHTSLRETLGKQIGEAPIEAADGEPLKITLHSAADVKIGRITLRGSSTSGQVDEKNNFVLRGLRSIRRAPSLLLGANDKRKEVTMCCDLTLLPEATGRNIEGVIGMPLFQTKIVQLDFEQRRGRILSATTTPSSDWGQPINVSFNKLHLPTVEVELPGGINETCIVDTGCDGTMSLSSELFAKLTDTKKIIPCEDAPVYQVSGIKTVHVGRLAGAKIGGFENSDLLVRDGVKESLIGIRYLRRFFVTLDLGRQKMYLKKGAGFDAPDKEPALSIGMLRKNGTTIVYSVGRNSSGERAGIQINDELISVGGEAVQGKPHAEIRWMFREKADANGHLTLAMRRDGVERNIDVEINK